MEKTKQYVRGLVLLPFLTAGSPLAMLHNNFIAFNTEPQATYVSLSEEHAKKIDAYFAQRDMPLEGYGTKMVKAAEDNNLDWRLLPAIAVKESTGGKFACYKNPFGWGSCKIKFKDFDAAIDAVALNLGGGNPATERYYKNATTRQKLHHYNGSVIPAYTGEVIEFMELIEAGA